MTAFDILPSAQPAAPRAGTAPARRVLQWAGRNPFAAFGAVLLALIVAACAAAPLYAERVAGTGPNDNHAGETLVVDGREVPVLTQGGVTEVDGELELTTDAGEPIGPQWFAAGGQFVLGADNNGRDVAVRLLYGGRNSLFIGGSAAILSIVLGLALSLVAGYLGGWVGASVSWLFDLVWAFPVILLGVALGTVLQVGGIHHGPIQIDAGSVWIPVFVIAMVGVPYAGRLFQGDILSLRRREFVESARAEGAGTLRVMTTELLPNLVPTALALFPVLVANDILMESGLSFLGAGVAQPKPSWGNLIADGSEQVTTAPVLTIAPVLCIFASVLALNLFADSLGTSKRGRRDAR
jgi:peptide/nickel transport system permease protein